MQEALKRTIRHSNPSVDSFGSANATTNIHGILHNGDTMQQVASRSRSQVPPTGTIPADKFVDSFSGIMDNMESNATNDKGVPEKLVSKTTM